MVIMSRHEFGFSKWYFNVPFGRVPIIDPRYEWSIYAGPRIQTLPSLLLIGSKKLADGKSWQNSRDEL